MKCELCGAGWKTKGELGGWRHAESRCPLSGIAIYRPQVEAINAAIKQARKDNRKPDECKFKDSCSRMVYGHEDCTKENCCPCAAWEKDAQEAIRKAVEE